MRRQRQRWRWWRWRQRHTILPAIGKLCFVVIVPELRTDSRQFPGKFFSLKKT